MIIKQYVILSVNVERKNTSRHNAVVKVLHLSTGVKNRLHNLKTENYVLFGKLEDLNPETVIKQCCYDASNALVVLSVGGLQEV